MNKAGEKILLLLLGGVALGYCITPGQRKRVFKEISREWGKLEQKDLREGINYLRRLEFINEKEGKPGFFEAFLTEKGKLKALNYQLEDIKNKKGRWDGKWRMVAFDVPEKYKRGRDALRQKLKKIGFCEMQKSVFITPYNCIEEIGCLVKFFELERYVRFGVLEYVNNSSHFKKIFKLSDN